FVLTSYLLLANEATRQWFDSCSPVVRDCFAMPAPCEHGKCTLSPRFYGKNVDTPRTQHSHSPVSFRSSLEAVTSERRTNPPTPKFKCAVQLCHYNYVKRPTDLQAEKGIFIF